MKMLPGCPERRIVMNLPTPEQLTRIRLEPPPRNFGPAIDS